MPLAAPPPDERGVDAELVEAARDDEVDEVLDRLGAVVEARRGEEDHGAGVVERREPAEVDRRERRLARDEHEACRRSFSATEAARWMRFAIAPEASVPTVAIEQGQTT